MFILPVILQEEDYFPTKYCLCLCPVGLEDMVLSALVQEQVEGISPGAIALMSPRKMAVSVNHDSMAN